MKIIIYSVEISSPISRATWFSTNAAPFWAKPCILWYKHDIWHILSMTHNIGPMLFQDGTQPDLACGGCGSHFQNGWHEFSMSHISANNIDMKFIIVSLSMFSGSRTPNMAIILVCGGCSSHFQNGWHEFSMSHILANNTDRKLILVSLSLFAGSWNQNMAIILVCGGCGNHFQNGWHEFSMSISRRIMETQT